MFVLLLLETVERRVMEDGTVAKPPPVQWDLARPAIVANHGPDVEPDPGNPDGIPRIGVALDGAV